DHAIKVRHNILRVKRFQPQSLVTSRSQRELRDSGNELRLSLPAREKKARGCSIFSPAPPERRSFAASAKRSPAPEGGVEEVVAGVAGTPLFCVRVPIGRFQATLAMRCRGTERARATALARGPPRRARAALGSSLDDRRGKLVGVVVSEPVAQRHPQDLAVEPERPVLDVVEVVLDPLPYRRVAAP